MSTRSTIFLTNENEHWHKELNAEYNYGIEGDDNECYVLEFSGKHIVEVDPDSGNVEVVIDPKSPLGQEIAKMLRANR